MTIYLRPTYLGVLEDSRDGHEKETFGQVGSNEMFTLLSAILIIVNFPGRGGRKIKTS
jgi:hypothetical protein